MAYAVPKVWEHGDVPTAADMDKYSDALDAIHAKSGDVARNYAALREREFYRAEFADSDYFLVHKFRYLFFKSTGSIVSLADSTQTESLSDGGAAWGVYDLDGVSWLAYGMVYQVTGVSFCFESETGNYA